MKTNALLLALLLAAGCSSVPNPDVLIRDVLERTAYLRGQHNAAHGGREAKVVRVIEDDLRRLAKEHGALLRDALKSPEMERRTLAAFALGYSGSREALPLLVEASRDPAEELRIHAIVALGTLGTAETPAEPFVRLLMDESPAVRTAALYGIRRMPSSGRDAGLVEAVHARFADDSSDVRNEAAITAGRMGLKESIALLLAGPIKDREPVVRQNAALALGRIGAPAKAATPNLIELLRDEDTRVVDGAWRSLNVIHEKDFDRSYPTWRDWYEDEQRYHYLCLEHKDVVQPGAGDCPRCGKKLDRQSRESGRKGGDASAAGDVFVCPAHPEVQTASAARCGKPGCGKELAPQKPVSVIHACVDHPEVQTTAPARCGRPGCGKDLVPKKP